MASSLTPDSYSRLRTTNLKGIAIVAVILLHTLSALPWSITRHQPTEELAIILDQLSRFSVPMFLFLSALGLGLKYQNRKFSTLGFYLRRFTKILPPYILWSVAIFLLLTLIPEWSTTGEHIPWNKWPAVFLLGQADYQFYFIPLIIQFYLLYPLLRGLNRAWFWLIMITGGTSALYVFLLQTGLLASWFPRLAHSDYWQYLPILGWLGYCGLGTLVASRQLSSTWKKMQPWLKWLLLMSLLWLITAATRAITTGRDPLMAEKFTRLPVLVYASVVCIWGLRTRLVVSDLTTKLFNFLGRHSLKIYFMHTILIRIIFGSFLGHLSLLSGLLALAVLTVTNYAHLKLHFA